MTTVRLSTVEMRRSAIVGIMRRLNAKCAGRSETYGRARDPWDTDIEAACAECAVAKGVGIEWAGATEPDYDGDVGPLGVRYTNNDRGSLILHERDPGDKVFVLVTGADGAYVLRGWILAADGKREEYWRTDVRTPAFFVPQSALEDIERL